MKPFHAKLVLSAFGVALFGTCALAQSFDRFGDGTYRRVYYNGDGGTYRRVYYNRFGDGAFRRVYYNGDGGIYRRTFDRFGDGAFRRIYYNGGGGIYRRTYYDRFGDGSFRRAYLYNSAVTDGGVPLYNSVPLRSVLRVSPSPVVFGIGAYGSYGGLYDLNAPNPPQETNSGNYGPSAE
jgi:hypothetical protein